MAEDWTDLTTVSWDGILSAGELAQIPQEDRRAALVAMAAEVRTMIASHAPNTLSADSLKIPAGFVARALLVVRNRLLTVIPDYAIDEDRRKQGEQAETWLLEVARGRIRPQPASDAVANEAAPEKPSLRPKIAARRKQYGRDQQDGI